MHYFVYLDEFGHIGPFVSRSDKKYKTSPVFGLGGIALPVNEIRNFSMFFYKQKIQALGHEIQISGKLPSKWEKKGSEFYTVKNVTKYHGVRSTTNRIINKINKMNGFIFGTGIVKEPPSPNHKSEALYASVLRDAIRKLNTLFTDLESTFSLFLDAADSP